jgi:GNAT superfamily N-acetyltransferase
MSARGALAVRRVARRTELDAFIRLPWRLYAADPSWVPPLIADVRAALESRKHPFHRHAEIALFLALRDGAAVGRIAAVDNHAYNDFHGGNVGFFGLFECEEDAEATAALLGAAEEWLRARGRSTVEGPMNLSTNDELFSPGVLIDGFDTPPSVMMAHTPPYYARLLEAAGYQARKDLLAYWVDGSEGLPERFMAALERARRAANVHIRSLDMKRFDDEVAIIQDIYHSAWEQNWGFVPMTPEEIGYMAKHLKPVVNPRLCGIAEIDGEPIAFALALPDYNQALRHLDGRLLPFGVLKLLWYRRRINAVRVITLGIKPPHRHKGIDGMLIGHIFREASRIGAPRGECSWILEDNSAMRRGIERVGGTVYKTYRVYGRSLEPAAPPA